MKDETSPAVSRRNLLRGAAVAGAATLAAAPALAKSSDLADVRKAAEAGKQASIERLRKWVALPSIAAENRNMAEGAAYVAQLARDSGFQHAEVVATDGCPGVFATLDAGARHTLGLYFMYDVKQYDPAEWTMGGPLDGKLVDKPGVGTVMVGRGSFNQKGAEEAFLAALRAIRAAGRKLPVNLVMVCEGEEEIGSPHLRQIVTKPHVLEAFRKCEGVFMPSASQGGKSGTASIELGAKGILELELISSGETWGRGPTQDTHSSMKAMLDSPVWRLVLALQTLVSPDGNRPAIDGWFENVRPLTAREKALIRSSVARSGTASTLGGDHVTHWINDWPLEEAMEHLVADPTINIEGLVAGYTGPGGKTVLPHRAVAKLDFRLVPNQTHAEAVRKLRAHLDKHGYPDIEMKVGGGYDPTETDENSRLIRAEIATYAKLGVEANLNPRLAGSWPGGTFTQAPVSQPVGRFGLGSGANAHAPDEYYIIESANPKVAGLVDQTMGYAELLFAFAAIK